MAQVLPLGGNTVVLIIVTGIVGGLVAGFAALAGSFLRASANNKAAV
jgi:LPS O-antigen subunit length determinant protein (WzzB/FepE family)